MRHVVSKQRAMFMLEFVRATVRAIRRNATPVARVLACCLVFVAISRSASAEGEETVLVLYDQTGDSGYLGELYAMAMGTLVSHFGSWRAEPVGQYRAGELAHTRAVVYIGSS
jgi:hypothetical protein